MEDEEMFINKWPPKGTLYYSRWQTEMLPRQRRWKVKDELKHETEAENQAEVFPPRRSGKQLLLQAGS